ESAVRGSTTISTQYIDTILLSLFFFLLSPPPPRSTLFPYTTLFRSDDVWLFSASTNGDLTGYVHGFNFGPSEEGVSFGRYVNSRSEEHTSELQSQSNLVCRLLLEKKKK